MFSHELIVSDKIQISDEAARRLNRSTSPLSVALGDLGDALVATEIYQHLLVVAGAHVGLAPHGPTR